jgi:hypothetical protein
VARVNTRVNTNSNTSSIDKRIKPLTKDCKKAKKKSGGNFCSPIKLFSKKFDQKKWRRKKEPVLIKNKEVKKEKNEKEKKYSFGNDNSSSALNCYGGERER